MRSDDDDASGAVGARCGVVGHTSMSPYIVPRAELKPRSERPQRAVHQRDRLGLQRNEAILDRGVVHPLPLPPPA